MAETTDPTADLRARLARLLDAEIHGLRRLTGGASRETWSFDAVGSDGTVRELILRRDPPGVTVDTSRKSGMLTEAMLFGAAYDAGVPVPVIRASGAADPDVLDAGFLVMDRLAGETIARKIQRDDEYAGGRANFVRDVGTALARLHAVPLEKVPGLEAYDVLARYRTVLDELGYPSPAFELGFRWLEANRPAGRPTVLVHGDFRLGNVIVGPEGLVAVLDWELAHLGDPMEDFGWLCTRAWRFGGKGVVGGIGDLDDLCAAYEAAGGTPDRAAAHWWMVAGTLIWGVMCGLQARVHTSGAVFSHEHAAIGRRIAEQEHDLLDLMGVPAVALPVVPPETDQWGLFGMPTARGLVDAVRQFLERDVMPSTEGRVNFHTRVAVNMLAIVERELALSPSVVSQYSAGLLPFGVDDEAGLAAAIRSGSLDARRDEVAAFVRSTVSARLAAANPRWAV